MEFEEALSVNRALVKVAKLYRAAQAGTLSELGLHPGQDVLLWHLGRQPDGMLISEIAGRLAVEQPTVTRSLSRLAGGGWFVRETVPGDRRAIRIRLTPKGEAAIPRIEAAWRGLAESATAGMGADQRAQLTALLEKVRANLLT
ncbi:MarR family winged helix-turn-helix transcriptional regulator [Actinoplanes aureus]|uniref:Winged helix-turn-helix transcriptional regulator n=1 Tax=Actinoplanes aureus TaxID=2792083 RepID=A0A931CEX9_9ACTN|nr:MarR family winged helix-turn-helix transcriptional regulator [Actinoplanes aureus]MBG0568869.1 winged helix-turn-helix transcriptional regulator [Actinoplanes aureus]